MKKLSLGAHLGELLGTCILTLLVSASILVPNFPIPTPIVAGLTLGMLVYAIGPVSGAHVNPAVTIGLWSIGKVPHLQAVTYVLVQVLGAVIAMGVSPYLFGSAVNLDAGETFGIGIAEATGAFVFISGVSAVVLGRVKAEASGLTIGTSLLLGILLAIAGSNGVLNPAVALGLGSISIAYVAGPIIGGIAAAWCAKALGAK